MILRSIRLDRAGKYWGTLCAICLAVAVATTLVWAATEQDVENLIDSMSISNAGKVTVKNGFLQGIQAGRLSADGAFDFLQRVATSGADLADRETVLVSIASTLLADIPVDMLVNKVVEGLARGLAMDVIAEEVAERRQTLTEVRTLLTQKGISAAKFSQTGVDAATTDIATVLENHVRSGQSPSGGTLLDQTLTTLDRDGRVSDGLFQSLSNSLSEGELAGIANNIASRI